MAEYIERKRVIDELTRIACQVPDSKRRTVARCISAVELLPTTLPVAPVRHGHWIDCEDVYSSYVRCSECGDEFTCREADCAHTDFCPGCGADMRGDAGNA